MKPNASPECREVTIVIGDLLIAAGLLGLGLYLSSFQDLLDLLDAWR